MKIAIIGGRNFNNYQLLLNTLAHKHDKISLIVSGGADGADTLAERFADEFNIKKSIHDAEWDNLDTDNPCVVKYNKRGKPYNCLAGFNRNTDIITECDILIAFWNGKSPGTKDSIDKAASLNKKIKVITY